MQAEARVDVQNDLIMSSAEIVQKALSTWFKKKNLHDISFEENFAPGNDLHASYQSVYEAKFMPHSPDQALVKVTCTRDGQVGVGFEEWRRVAAKAKTTVSFLIYSDRFVGGHELLPMTEKALITLLDIIAEGRMGIQYRSLPLLGIVGCNAVVQINDFEKMAMSGYPEAKEWVRQMNFDGRANSKNFLISRPWT